MNKNILITLLILILAGGSIALYLNKGSTTTLPDATSTAPVAQDTAGTHSDPGALPPVTTVAGIPAVSTNSTITTSDTTAIVSGSVRPNGAFTSYWYEYGITASLGSKTSIQALGSGFAAIKAPGYITRLAPNTTYYFRIVAENQYGRVSGSQFAFKTSEGTASPVGGVPSAATISAADVTRTTADIRGDVTPNQASTLYWFEYGKTRDLGNTSAFTQAGNGTAKATVHTSLLNLEPATTYYFRINAQNQFGTVNGSVLSFKTLGPSVQAAPGITTGNAASVENTTASLEGTVKPNGLQTTYWFEYSTSSFGDASLVRSTGKAVLGSGKDTTPVSAGISRLARGTTYYYRLVGQNSLGLVHGDILTLKTK